MSIKHSNLILLGVALIAATPLISLGYLHPIFDYSHAWVSAHHATIVRAFTEEGVFKLHFMPVQNNAPLTNEPDYYVDWPPLYDVLLVVLGGITHGVPAALHVLMAFVAGLIAVMLGRSITQIFGLVPGIMTCVAYLLMPIVLKYGFGLFHVQVAIAFAIASLMCWRAWLDSGRPIALIASCVFLGAAVMTSWEPLLLGGGAFLTVLLSRDRQRALPAALIVGVTMMIAFVAVVLLYITQAPGVLTQLSAKAAEQSGLKFFATSSVFHPHDLRYLENMSLDQQKWSKAVQVFVERLAWLGKSAVLGLVVSVIVFLRRRDVASARAFGLYFPLLSLWLLWAILMRRHYLVHNYETLIAAPVAAVSVGIMAAYFLKLSQERSLFGSRQAVQAVAILAVAIPIVFDALHTYPSILGDHANQPGVDLGLMVKAKTPDKSIVITTDYSMIPMYYSQRHLVQGVENDQAVLDHSEAFRDLCGDCSVFFLAANDTLPLFSKLLSQKQLIDDTGSFSLYKIADGGEAIH